MGKHATKQSEFVGCSPRAATITAIRSSIKYRSDWGGGIRFDLSAIQRLPSYDPFTFAGWLKGMHCATVPEGMVTFVQSYLVNYFLLPDGDEFDVEALRSEVFPEPENPPTKKVVFKIGRYSLVKE